ncbi:hypothetical protein M0R72_18405 [Candidatus Pacearchaeota archaeon]|jgi:hypothetical protein|nr:hypothetical protein [Candidatus Pacearchaeota archaeon]
MIEKVLVGALSGMIMFGLAVIMLGGAVAIGMYVESLHLLSHGNDTALGVACGLLWISVLMGIGVAVFDGGKR